MNPQCRVGLIGPLPPPNGGMANQALQLVESLKEQDIYVEFLQTNSPYKPAFVEKLILLRAVIRLIPYLWQVWRLSGRVDVIHLMANSGWSWQLFAAPVLWFGWLRKTPVILNYHGGEAREYFKKSYALVKPSLAKAACIVVPSEYLKEVFAEFGYQSKIIPNIIDLNVFLPAELEGRGEKYTILITRNLEPIYGLDTAIRAIAIARDAIPNVYLNIAGSGPQLAELQQLVRELGLTDCVSFPGRLERAAIVAMCRSADVLLNPALVDNMPISVLEALACGLPVVSTNVGGIPYMVEHDKSALLVDPGDAQGMAQAMVRLHSDKNLQKRLRKSGLSLVQKFSAPDVIAQWLSLYQCQSVRS